MNAFVKRSIFASAILFCFCSCTFEQTLFTVTSPDDALDLIGTVAFGDPTWGHLFVAPHGEKFSSSRSVEILLSDETSRLNPVWYDARTIEIRADSARIMHAQDDAKIIFRNYQVVNVRVLRKIKKVIDLPIDMTI